MLKKSDFIYYALRKKALEIAGDPKRLLFYMKFYLNQMALGRDSVVIVSYPKSGRTWLEQILVELARQKHGLSETDPRTYVELCLEYEDLPKVTFTHAGSSWESGIKDEEDVLGIRPVKYAPSKFIFLYRDPRDVQVSAYHHIKNRTGITKLKRQDMVSNPVVGARKIARFLKIWCDYLHFRKDDGLAVRYEEMKAVPEETVHRISEFIGFTVTEEQVRQALRDTSFRKMQEKERKGEFANPWLQAVDQYNENSFKVRSGKTGSYLTFFSPEQIEELNRIFTQEGILELLWNEVTG